MTAPTSICPKKHPKTPGKDCRVCHRERGLIYKRSLSGEQAGWASLRDNARRRGLILGISRDEYKALRDQPCYFCGESFSRGKCSYSIDRLDNTQGYLKDNTVACCYRCNHA